LFNTININIIELRHYFHYYYITPCHYYLFTPLSLLFRQHLLRLLRHYAIGCHIAVSPLLHYAYCHYTLRFINIYAIIMPCHYINTLSLFIHYYYAIIIIIYAITATFTLSHYATPFTSFHLSLNTLYLHYAILSLPLVTDAIAITLRHAITPLPRHFSLLTFTPYHYLAHTHYLIRFQYRHATPLLLLRRHYYYAITLLRHYYYCCRHYADVYAIHHQINSTHLQIPTHPTG